MSEHALWPIRLTMPDKNDPWFRRLPADFKERIRLCRAEPIALGATREWGHKRVQVPTDPGVYVYAWFDAAGSPLYVGRTTRPIQRCSGHTDKPWWGDAVSVKWERQANEQAAYWRELEVIGLLQPSHNIIGTDRSIDRKAGAA